jgi:hypothetical protein
MGRDRIPGTYAFYWGARKSAYPYGLGAQIAKREFVGAGSFAHEGFGASCLTIDPTSDFVSAFFVPSSGGWTAEAADNPGPIIWGGIEDRAIDGRGSVHAAAVGRAVIGRVSSCRPAPAWPWDPCRGRSGRAPARASP